jgi:hypothetical protein
MAEERPRARKHWERKHVGGAAVAGSGWDIVTGGRLPADWLPGLPLTAYRLPVAR